MVLETKKEMNIDNPKTLGHFLSSALHLEEQFRRSVYRDYLDLEDWPVDLKPEVFEKIKNHLTTLIEDSAKHEQVIHRLARDYIGDEIRDKTRIIRELELMEGFELSAKDFYRRICSNSKFKDRRLEETFEDLADTEQRHADIVREIISLVSDASP